jgi:hypothetical protein
MIWQSLVLLLTVCSLPLQIFAQQPSEKKIHRYQQLFFIQPPTVEIQNWTKEPVDFPEGYYYQFLGVKQEDKTILYPVNHPRLLLGYLLGQGIEIEEAWHRDDAPSCGIYEVIVSSSLAIRTLHDKHDDQLKALGFFKVDEPKADCPYTVYHYIFHAR